MAAVTVATNARGWYDPASGTVYWTARCVHDTGTALYAVLQDSGATPKVRVFKANSRTAPTSWTEQDAANNKAVTNVNFPFSSDPSPAGNIDIVVFTATNTLTWYQFNPSTDTWSASTANQATAAKGERPVRVARDSAANRYVAWTDNADDADLPWSFGGANTFNLAATSTEASNYLDVVRDTTDRIHHFYWNCAADDFLYRSRLLGVDGTGAAIDAATAWTVETAGSAGGRFNLFDNAGTDSVYVAYLSSTGTIKEALVTLEADSATGNVSALATVEATAADVGTRTPLSTAVVGGVPYCAWWDDAASGTIYYSTKSGGTWAAKTAFATGVTNLIEIVPVGTDGLLVVYQSGTSVVMDWILTPGGAAPEEMTRPMRVVRAPFPYRAVG